MAIAAAPLLDPVELERRCLGDPAMRVELLALFIAEAERLMRQIEAAPDELLTERVAAMAALARGIGATRLRHSAHALQLQIIRGEAELGPLRGVVDDTLAYLRRAST